VICFADNCSREKMADICVVELPASGS